MKLPTLLPLVPLLLALTATADNTPVSTTIAWDASNPTNKILLTWEAIPTKQ